MTRNSRIEYWSYWWSKLSSDSTPPCSYCSTQHRKGLIERIPRTHRYQLTQVGREVAVLFTKTHQRVLAPGLVALDPHLPDDITQRHPLATAWRHLERALDDYIDNGLIAA
jgi:hypothetical protein